LIVGGGINGAGLFRDLALQGVDVLLIDKGDFCSGASAAPSRMIHGGLRYLEFGEFSLVRESLKDRNLLLANAAHYVRPLPTVIPIFAWFSGAWSCVARFLHVGGSRPAHRGVLMVKMGLSFYDLFTRKNRATPTHTFASRADSLARRPLLNPRLVKTATYYDASITYPERLAVELLIDGEAACPDALAVNYLTLQEGSADSVVLRDECSAETFTVRPRVLVNAAGAWIDFTNRTLGHPTKMIG
jgi:glycerol-3-phosphate dehydrogenase